MESKKQSCRYAFLGAGNMATAIIGAMKSGEIALFDVNKEQYAKFAGKPYLFAESAKEAVEASDFVFLAVKPQSFDELMSEIKGSGVPLGGKVFVTIAAGISTSYISSALGGGVPVIRAMPNTPLLYGCGVTALCRGEGVKDEAFEEIRGIFGACGTVFELPESQMNTVIAATSSAPAYVYLFIKAIADAAEAQGLTAENLTSLVCDMVIGSAETLKRSPLTAGELIKIVCSKGGTTERAMSVLNERGFSEIVADAMQSCTDRANEIGR